MVEGKLAPGFDASGFAAEGGVNAVDPVRDSLPGRLSVVCGSDPARREGRYASRQQEESCVFLFESFLSFGSELLVEFGDKIRFEPSESRPERFVSDLTPTFAIDFSGESFCQPRIDWSPRSEFETQAVSPVGFESMTRTRQTLSNQFWPPTKGWGLIG